MLRSFFYNGGGITQPLCCPYPHSRPERAIKASCIYLPSSSILSRPHFCSCALHPFPPLFVCTPYVQPTLTQHFLFISLKGESRVRARQSLMVAVVLGKMLHGGVFFKSSSALHPRPTAEVKRQVRKVVPGLYPTDSQIQAGYRLGSSLILP